MVLFVGEDEVRDLDYETDVLAAIDWRGFDPADLASRVPENAQAAESQLQRIRLSDDGKELFFGETVEANAETLRFDPAHAVRMISDIVLNPFVGREIVAATVHRLRARGFDDAKLGQLASLIVEELRKGLDEARNARAEALFKAEVEAGRIQFSLRLDGRNWRMPFAVETSEADNVRQLVNRAGGPLEKSLFSPIYESELNSDERDVAVYLDGEKALTWWHRNVARTQYGIQGWKKARIYPDFIFAVQKEGEAARLTVLETKGDQLDNLDTAYKRRLLDFLSDHFSWDGSTPAGELALIGNTGETVRGTLILMSEWRTKLPAYLL
jgi:type III restriction enzyme